MRRTLTAFAVASALVLGLGIGLGKSAYAEDKHKNLKVLDDNGKMLELGMKTFSKGLGVKCNVCHEKGKFETDVVPAKEDARKFFAATIGEKDAAKKDAALKTLLDVLKLKEVKSAQDVWDGVGQLKKKADAK